MSGIVIAGCGYVGIELARVLDSQNDDVWGIRRDPAGLPGFVRPVAADLNDTAILERTLPERIDALVYCASPDDGSDESYARVFGSGLASVLSLAQQRGARRAVFVSSTSVYAQTDGRWVDEDSPTEPSHHSGRRLLEAETLVRAAPLRGITVRAGGIYGPGRTRLLDRVRRGEERYVPGHYTNRIFRDDLAAAIAHLLAIEDPEDRYLAVDHEPAEHREVLEWIAAKVAAHPPRAADSTQGRKARSNKRCDSTRLRRSGFIFRFPTFREGYFALLSPATNEGMHLFKS